MADAIGVASSLLALAIFSFESSITLYNTVRSFRHHPKCVRDLTEEIEALSSVLGPLTEMVSAKADGDFSALELPLLRCGNLCKEFEQVIIKAMERSKADRTSFRNWSKLRYIGEDIDGFRRILAGYKSTIGIALTDATLRKSSATVQYLENYKYLIERTTTDLEAHLESIDEKLAGIFEHVMTASDTDSLDQQTIKEEQLSIRKCLQICARLSQHIDQSALSSGHSPEEDNDLSTFSEKITHYERDAIQKRVSNCTKATEQVTLNRATFSNLISVNRVKAAARATTALGQVSKASLRDISLVTSNRVSEVEDLNHLTATDDDVFRWCCRWKTALLRDGSGRDRLLCSTSNIIVKINNAAVVKFGPSVTASEAANQTYAYDVLTTTQQVFVPYIYKYCENHDEDGRTGYLVMEYIHGQLATDLPAEEFQYCISKLSTAIRAMWQLVGDRPGPVDAGEPRGTIWAPDSRAYENFAERGDLEQWFQRALRMENARIDLATLPLVFCHLDLAARNVILGENSVIYLLDWASAGFYPRAFEIWVIHSSVAHESKFSEALLSALPKIGDDEEQLHYTIWQAYRLNMLHDWSNKNRDVPVMEAPMPATAKLLQQSQLDPECSIECS